MGCVSRSVGLVAVCLAAAWGCSSRNNANATPDVSASPEGGAEESPMPSGFQGARQAFAAAVAAAKSLPVAEIDVGPPHQVSADRMAEKVGGFWALRARLDGDPTRDVYGWANGEGQTALIEAGLGHMLEEAGLWSESPALPLRETVGRILWAMGEGGELNINPAGGAPPPTLELADDGSGTLTFSVSIQGAAGRHGPNRTTKITVRLGADHSARLEEAPLEPPAAQ